MNLERLTQATIEIAKEAGKFIAKERQAFETNKIEYKDLNNVVSYVDKEAEKMLVEKLGALLPEAGFITEEDTVENDDERGLNWIIDPLDGTANFVHNMPHYSVSVALYDGKKGLIGVVYEICRDKTFWTFKDGGAFCEGVKLLVSNSISLDTSLFATGFPYYKFEKMHNYLQILESLMQKTHGLRRAGSAALDLAYVAAGYYDGFFEYNLRSWDMAAGILLIQEAGGIVTDFTGGDNYLFGGDIVAGSDVQKELLKEIKRFW
jgi:myo-inositol-1(or 4)-monophosphatase